MRVSEKRSLVLLHRQQVSPSSSIGIAEKTFERYRFAISRSAKKRSSKNTFPSLRACTDLLAFKRKMSSRTESSRTARMVCSPQTILLVAESAKEKELLP